MTTPRYLERLLEAYAAGAFATPGLSIVTIRHDDDCPLLSDTGACTCDPQIDIPPSADTIGGIE